MTGNIMTTSWGTNVNQNWDPNYVKIPERIKHTYLPKRTLMEFLFKL